MVVMIRAWYLLIVAVDNQVLVAFAPVLLAVVAAEPIASPAAKDVVLDEGKAGTRAAEGKVIAECGDEVRDDFEVDLQIAEEFVEGGGSAGGRHGVVV